MTTGTTTIFTSGNFASNALLSLPTLPATMNLWVYTASSLTNSQDVYSSGPISNANGGGGPTYSSGYASFNGNGQNFMALSTNVSDVAGNLVFCILTRSYANNSGNNIALNTFVAGNKGNNGFGPAMIIQSNATNSIFRNAMSMNGPALNMPILNISTNLYNWKLLAFTWDSVGFWANCYSLTDNISNTVQGTTGNIRILANTNTWCLGGIPWTTGGVTTNSDDRHDIAFATISQNQPVPTSTQLQTLRTFLLQVLQNNGVTGF